MVVHIIAGIMHIILGGKGWMLTGGRCSNPEKGNSGIKNSGYADVHGCRIVGAAVFFLTRQFAGLFYSKIFAFI